MAIGEIKRLSSDRGFGFIRPDGEKDDLFFHSSAVQGAGFDSLREGQRVEFEKGADDRDARRSRALNVRVVA
jgi:cold shock protein